MTSTDPIASVVSAALGIKEYLIMGAIGLVAAGSVVGGIYLKGHHDATKHDQPIIAAAKDQAQVSDLNTQGAKDTAQRVDLVVHQTSDAQAVVSAESRQASQAEDAHAPLDPSRADRLRNSDSQLCVTDQRLVGCQHPG